MPRAIGLGFSLLLLACATAESDDERARCDPRAAVEQPTELRVLLAAGRAADGTLYVVDHAADGPTDDRAFVSELDAIHRVELDSIVGGLSEGQRRWSYSVPEHEPPFAISISKAGDVVRMGVLLGDANQVLFTIGEEGEELVLVDEAVVRALPAYDLERTFEFTLAARTPSGRTFAYLSPENAPGDEDRRVFLGKDALDEHEVVSVANDDGATTISFDVGSTEPAVARFPAFPSPTQPATLTIDGSTEWLTLLEPHLLQSEGFRCFTE